MATRLIGVDDANPKLPDVVIDATAATSTEALAGTDDTLLMTPPALYGAMPMEDTRTHLIGAGTDDAIALNAAMTAAITNKRPLFVPTIAGDYSVDTQVVVPSGLRLVSNGAVIVNNIPSATAAVSLNGVSDVVIQDLDIDGAKASYAPVTEHRHGITLYNCSGVRLFNVKSHDNKGDGLYIGHSTLGITTDVQAFGCEFTDNHRNNLSIIHASNVKFFGCSFDRAGGTAPESGVDIEPNEDDDVIDDIQFYGCTANDNTDRGFLVAVRGAPTAVQRNIGFYGCTATGNTTDGFELQNATDVTVEGGLAAENGGNGVQVTGANRNVRVVTTAENNGQHGFFHSSAVATGLTVGGHYWHNSAATSNTYDGIHLAGTAGSRVVVLPGTVAGGPSTGARQRYGLRAGSGTTLTHVGCHFPNNVTARHLITATELVQINETDWTMPSYLRMPSVSGGPFVKLALTAALATGADTDFAYGLGTKPTSTHGVMNVRGGIASATSSGVDTQVNGTDAVQVRGTASPTAYVKFIDRFLEVNELSADPAAPAADTARLYVKDNGAGKTQLCVRFPTGAVQVIATEP